MSSVVSQMTGTDSENLEGLRRRELKSIRILVETHHNGLLRMAQVYLRDPDVSAEVVQETWIAVLEGIHRFEGRSSVKSWIYAILIKKAKTRAVRERRVVNFSSLSGEDDDDPAGVDPDRFLPEGDPNAGHWSRPPRSWGESPEEILDRRETLELIETAIAALPPRYAAVITLRDVQGFSGQEVCNTLGISETNQRVLLHRARTRVRQELESKLGPAAPGRGRPGEAHELQ